MTAEPAAKLVIAHRGASGYLPEHTLPAYAMAHAQGADLIEPDVVLTRDGVLICLHDLYLETTTDAARRFPPRARPDGHHYAADFTLEEIRTLRVFGRTRDPEEQSALPRMGVPTLEELIQLVRHLNRTTGRDCGLLVETKAPVSFHAKEDRPLEEPLLALLDRYGYRDQHSRVVVQSFEAESLRRMRALGSKLPLVQLTSRPVTELGLTEIARYANGVAPSRAAFLSAEAGALAGAKLVQTARRLGLSVYVWTFNAEEPEMRRFLWEDGVDGVITNHPDVGRRAAQPPP